MKIVQCNMGYSGYWLACWRELMRRVDLKVLTPETKYAYSVDSLAGMPIRVLTDAEMSSAPFLADLVVAERPDVLVIGGWVSKSFVALLSDRRLAATPKVLIMDAAWEGSLKQFLNRFRLRRFIKNFAAIIVGGKRGRTYARWLGFGAECIYRSIYGYDASGFADCYAQRMSLADGWPRRFCYVGRYARVKGIDTLLKAYRMYRQKVESPWPLDCYGKGELQPELCCVDGVIDHGFLQPTDLPAALVKEGVFIFPSIREPWGVAAVEAAGAGLPMICSNMVTSADDVVIDGRNGFIVKVGDARALCDALVRMHGLYGSLHEMGAVSKRLANDFSPRSWADRWMEVFDAVSR